MAVILDQAGNPIADMSGEFIEDLGSVFPKVIFNTSFSNTTNLHSLSNTTKIEMVYLGRDNSIVKELRYNEVLLDSIQMADITGVGVVYKGVLYTSAQYSDAFGWSTTTGRINLILGRIPSLPLGRDSKAEVVIYTQTHPLGIIWAPLDIRVVDPES
ncbi:MAG: hypothetical protein M0Q95_17870 [Porticoccaceae bacterium]|nr:hypothetical protein [Porticoccaceae bacterium]